MYNEVTDRITSIQYGFYNRSIYNLSAVSHEDLQRALAGAIYDRLYNDIKLTNVFDLYYNDNTCHAFYALCKALSMSPLFEFNAYDLFSLVASVSKMCNYKPITKYQLFFNVLETKMKSVHTLIEQECGQPVNISYPSVEVMIASLRNAYHIGYNCDWYALVKNNPSKNIGTPLVYFGHKHMYSNK